MLCDTDDHQQAETIIHTDVAVDTICPPVHIPLLAQITLTPAAVLVNPVLLQSTDGVGGKPLGLIAQQRRQRILVIARTHALQIQPGQQLLDTPGALQVRRQQRAVEADAGTATIPDLWHLDLDIADTRLDSALWQIAIAHDSLATIR